MSAPDTHDLHRLAKAPFLDEIHHLCWISPLINSGQLDSGWSCRDHAWLVALVVRVLGYGASILHGEAVFHPAARSPGSIPNIHQRLHSWVGIDGLGFIDLSVKPDGGYPDEFNKLRPLRPVLLSEFVPRTAGRVIYARNRGELADAVERWTTRKEKAAAIYLPTVYDTLYRQIISDVFQWVNSPLTDRLREKHSLDIYPAAALHLLGILKGSRQSLRSCSPEDAWAELAKDSAGASEKLVELARL